MKIGINGTICDEHEAVVSVYDHGFLYGIGLFETFRTYQGRPFLLKEHVSRLAESCQAVGIKYEPDQTWLAGHIDDLLAVNRLQDAYIRVSVSAGKEALGLPGGKYEHPNTIVYVKELPVMDPHLYTKGKALQMLRIRRNTPEGSVRLKSFHYMNNLLAKQELQQYPWAREAEGLFLNEQGYAGEGIVSNVFFVREEICFTPSVDTGILPGVTRAFIMRLAREQKPIIEVREGHYGWEEIVGADEVFLTNSVQQIVPVHACFDTEGKSRTIGDGRIGRLTRRLLERYSKATGIRMI